MQPSEFREPAELSASQENAGPILSSFGVG